MNRHLQIPKWIARGHLRLSMSSFYRRLIFNKRDWPDVLSFSEFALIFKKPLENFAHVVKQGRINTKGVPDPKKSKT